jgi:hypothetical protein
LNPTQDEDIEMADDEQDLWAVVDSVRICLMFFN